MLRAPIALERPAAVPDGGGGRARAYEPAGSSWAELATPTLRDAADADDLVALVRRRMRLRWRADLKPGWRVIVFGEAYRVRASADPDGRRRWLDLDTEREVR